MTFRKTIFWIHLLSGVISGLVITIMSVTGIAIAFESEILDFVDRDVSKIQPPSLSAVSDASSIEQVLAKLQKDRPEFKPTAIRIYNDPEVAYSIFAGREDRLYANPYTLDFEESQSHGAHEILHTIEEWHRWLGVDNGPNSLGRLITGVSNVAFFVLCITGLYLWFPRKWTKRMLRPALWFVKGRTGKAREFNWHNVFGFWSLIPLVVIVGTAIVISFGWAHDLVFKAVGEEPPQYRDFRMMLVKPPQVPTPPENARTLSYQEIFDAVVPEFASWDAIAINFPRKQSNSDLPDPVSVDVYQPASFVTRGYTPLSVDPFNGAILKQTNFEDRSTGIKARVWIRFLHTGAAFGLTGKIIATLATAASLVLVYTGFALAWRRFF